MSPDPRRPLAALRLDANRAIDAAFAPVAEAAEAAVLRHARTGPDGVPRLDPFGAALARTEIGRLLAARRLELIGAVSVRVAAAEALAERQAREVVG